MEKLSKVSSEMPVPVGGPAKEVLRTEAYPPFASCRPVVLLVMFEWRRVKLLEPSA